MVVLPGVEPVAPFRRAETGARDAGNRRAADLTARAHSQAFLEEAQRRTESILASVADTHILLDRKWHYVYVNDAAVQAIGLPLEQIIGRTLWELYPDIIGTELETQYRRAMRRQQPVAFEFHYLTRNVWWENRFSPVPEGLAVFAINITARKQAEAERDQLAAIVRTANDAIIATALDGTIVSWNDGAARMYGHDAKDIIGCPVARLAPPDRADELATVVPRLIRGEHIDPYETVGVRRDGAQIDISVTVSPINDVTGHISRVCTIARDITERKRAADAIRRSRHQLRALSAHLQTIREEERTRMAREIHDELGQVLTGLKMELSLLEQSWRRDGLDDPLSRYEPAFRRMGHLVDGSIQTVRKIATELRPMILDSLGLSAAIEWHTHEFLKASGIACELSLAEGELAPDPVTATALFRILQESLTNIVRHAQASRVTVCLRNEQQATVLSVADNGVGIRNRLNGRATAFGLLGMHERAIMLGGMFEVTSGPGGVGTTITARVPHAAPPAGQTAPGVECCNCASAAAATAKVRGRAGRRASGHKRRQ